MDDQTVFDQIHDLATEEETLYAAAGDGGGLSTEASARLAEIEVALDRCYDFLHQRQARRAAGLDPDQASVRPAEVVERYQQ